MSASATTARYSGRCGECAETWESGDPIRRSTDGAWRHDDCPDTTDLTPRNPICPECWLDHPEGACDR